MDSEGNVVPSGQGTLWEYAVPEYNTQLWNLTYGPPYKDEINERAEVIDRENIQLQRTPIHIDPSSVLYNPDNPGFPPCGFMHIKVNDSDVEQNSILDWDVYTGKVRLAHTLTHRDDISVNYTYKEKFYEYSGFVGSGGIYTSTPPFPFEELDLNPTPGHNYGMFSSGNAAHVFLRPYMDVDNAVVVTNEGLYHNYTGVASGVYDFELGSLSLGPHCKIRDVELTDIRRRGGGLSVRGQENLDDVTSVQPEAEFFWDVGYFDGQAVPSNGVLVVDISNDLLTGNGGPFTESEIRQKVLKHMPLGSYPIINYVDGDRTIIKADDVKVYSAAGVYKFRYVGAVGETASLYCVGTKYEIKNNEDGFLVWDSDNANSSEYKFLNNGDSTSTTAGSYTLTIVFDGPGSLLFTVTIELT